MTVLTPSREQYFEITTAMERYNCESLRLIVLQRDVAECVRKMQGLHAAQQQLLESVLDGKPIPPVPAKTDDATCTLTWPD